MDVKERELVVGGTYRHFKGKIYKILLVANDSETNDDDEPRKLVVYEAQYGDKKVWIRDYDMFLSKVDKEKYPEVSQNYRFEQLDLDIERNTTTDLINKYKSLKEELVDFNENNEVIVGGTYRHFKGKMYKVLLIATDSETNDDDEPRKLVVYEAQYGDKKVWVRDYDMFLSEVDKEKYPDISQKYRFQLVLNKK